MLVKYQSMQESYLILPVHYPTMLIYRLHLEDNGKSIISSGKSRFTVQTLPVDDFPKIETEQWNQTWKLPASIFKQALTRTSFAMAQQDVRFYLNGLLLVSESEQNENSSN